MLSNPHPDRCQDHEQVLGKRHKPKRHIAVALLRLRRHVEIFAQLLVATDALAIDKGLWRGLNVLLRLELIDLFPVIQGFVVNTVTFAPEQIFAFKAKWTDMVTCHHSVQRGCFAHTASGSESHNYPNTGTAGAYNQRRT